VNIGNPVETSILEFANTINQLTGNRAGIVFKEGDRGEGDPQRRQPDITRARNILGWEPKIDLEAGILKTIPYFKQKLGIE
ncbi:MAG TPA: SDR family NAD-dependent epimerase/dehydratase, partial [Anaerolineales bacterium]